MHTIVVISTAISALATVGICLFTWLNYLMYREIQRKQDDQQQRFNDLFEGIVIATLLSGPSSTGGYDDCKKLFKSQYKGKTQIFNG